MIIVGLADIHGQGGMISAMGEELAGADVVLIAGDITDFGNEEAAGKIVSQIRKYNDQILAVSGNCDASGVSRYLTAEGINLNQECVVINSVAFVGIDASGENGKDQVESFKAKGLNGEQKVLLSHYPPMGTSLDVVNGGKHIGKAAILDFIERQEPELVLCGHVHEARGIDRMGRTTLVNPGPMMRGAYLYAEITDKLESVEIRQVRS